MNLPTGSALGHYRNCSRNDAIPPDLAIVSGTTSRTSGDVQVARLGPPGSVIGPPSNAQVTPDASGLAGSFTATVVIQAQFGETDDAVVLRALTGTTTDDTRDYEA